jgi:hypothetical protein
MREQFRQRVAAQQAIEQKARRQVKQDHDLVARVQAAPQARSSVPLDEEVTRAQQLARRNYLCLLSEKEVVQHFRDILTTGDAKSVRQLLDGLTGLLVPGDGSGGAGAGVRITMVNRLPRPAGSPALDVTPHREDA